MRKLKRTLERKLKPEWGVSVMLAAALASLPPAVAVTASSASAQVVAPVPTPPPRPPRAPRAWSEIGQGGVARIDTVVPFSSNGTIELSLVSGSIKVSTWDRTQVRVVATTSGPPSLVFDASSSHVSLEQGGRHNSRYGESGTATYDVTVPTGVRATLSAVSGGIDAVGIRGPVDVNVVSGRVNVRDLGSTLNVEGVSGDITAMRVASDARVENVSGRVSLSGVGGSVNAETVSGGMLLRGIT
ncbi:MAG: hypothetical protein M3Z05_23535, partial [Gemmatimonadota bacterium]|nr:hypothetical protein [Gemmatimonadota bacterium]